MRVAVFSTKRYDEPSLRAANEKAGHELLFLEHRLNVETAKLAARFDAVCGFVNDDFGFRCRSSKLAIGPGVAA